MSVMRMPDDVYATLAAVVQQFPHTGDDEARRAAMEKAVATIRSKHGLRWVWKTEHQNLMGPSKDGLGFVPDGVVMHGQQMIMFIWDTINGTTRQPHPPPLVSEEARKAFVLAVEPRDWLAADGAPSEPPDEPQEPQSTDWEARWAALEQRVQEAVQTAGGAYERAGQAVDLTALLAERIGRLKLVPAPELPDEDAVSTNSVGWHAHRIKARITG